jgi:hypothetical protein
VVELIEAYWTFAAGYYTKGGQPTSTLEGIRRSLHLLRRLYSTTPANDFGPVALKAVRGQMLGSGRLNRTTINKRIDIIRRMFKWGVADQLVTSQPQCAKIAVRTTARHQAVVPSSRRSFASRPNTSCGACHMPRLTADQPAVACVRRLHDCFGTPRKSTLICRFMKSFAQLTV